MTVRLTISICDDPGILKEAMSSINPDNDKDITMDLVDNKLKIEISNLKLSSIYNVSEDILRCYDISKKIGKEL